jgi:hypothetical protein
MSDLVHELEQLATELEWPPTPAFTPRAQAVPRRRRRRLSRGLIMAIALGILALGAGALAATGVIHFGGATITRVDTLPPVDRAPRLQLGTPITLGQARGLLRLTLPPRLARPDAAYTHDGSVSLLYLRDGRPRAVLTVLREGPGLFDKLVYTATKIRRVHVQGARGLYIPGIHVVDFIYEDRPRLSKPTLLWVRDGLTYRLEADDALSLASAG